MLDLSCDVYQLSRG